MEQFRPKIEFEKNPKEPVKVFYLFRHDPPVYDPTVDDEMKKHGYSGEKNYPVAFRKPEIPEVPSDYLPPKERLNKFSRREPGSKMIGKKINGEIDYKIFDNDVSNKESSAELMERATYEGGIDEIQTRKNLNFLEDLIKKDNFKPIFLVGPRTRHLFTFNSIMKLLKQDGVCAEDTTIFHTDKLTDINMGWLPMMRVAEKSKADDPWSLVKDPIHHEKMKNEGIETMEEIKDRMRKHIASLERGLAIKNTGEIKAGRDKIKPLFIEFTSDFEQRALLSALGFNEIKGVKTNYFETSPGSYICIEVAKNDTARIYYQTPNMDDREFLGEVNGFRNIINRKSSNFIQ